MKINNIDYDFDFNGNNTSRTDHNGNPETFSSNNIVEHKNINQPFKVEEDGTCSHDFNIDNFRGSHSLIDNDGNSQNIGTCYSGEFSTKLKFVYDEKSKSYRTTDEEMKKQ